MFSQNCEEKGLQSKTFKFSPVSLVYPVHISEEAVLSDFRINNSINWKPEKNEKKITLPLLYYLMFKVMWNLISNKNIYTWDTYKQKKNKYFWSF